MSTLSKRATPSQRRIMRAVEGAVRNVAHVHPAWNLPDTAARSIAKRAAGTLSAQWLDVLAATRPSPSDRAGEDSLMPSRPLSAHLRKRAGRGAPSLSKRSPLSLIKTKLGIMAGDARRAGEAIRLEALADALRVIDAISSHQRAGEK